MSQWETEHVAFSEFKGFWVAIHNQTQSTLCSNLRQYLWPKTAQHGVKKSFLKYLNAFSYSYFNGLKSSSFKLLICFCPEEFHTLKVFSSSCKYCQTQNIFFIRCILLQRDFYWFLLLEKCCFITLSSCIILQLCLCTTFSLKGFKAVSGGKSQEQLIIVDNWTILKLWWVI